MNSKELKKLVRRLSTENSKKVDRLFHQLHDEVFEEIDCLSCAKCCSGLGPRLNKTDVKRIAKHLQATESSVIEDYLQIDEDGDLIFKQMPCPFLGNDNYCSIYDSRPKACREYPHTNSKNMQSILGLTVKKAMLYIFVDLLYLF